uniref:Uncharacterized protein n=1 Tax=Strongyloides papillosus TaxID=174720 RepID=A0A0N5BE68_STREA
MNYSTLDFFAQNGVSYGCYIFAIIYICFFMLIMVTAVIVFFAVDFKNLYCGKDKVLKKDVKVTNDKQRFMKIELLYTNGLQFDPDNDVQL